MGKQPVLAYSIAGVAVAIAIAVVAASTLGLTTSAGAAPQTIAGTTVDPGTGLPAVEASMEESASTGGAVEYVYVDEPRSGHDDDDDEREHDEREHDEREHDEHEDEHDDDDD